MKCSKHNDQFVFYRGNQNDVKLNQLLNIPLKHMQMLNQVKYMQMLNQVKQMQLLNQVKHMQMLNQVILIQIKINQVTLIQVKLKKVKLKLNHLRISLVKYLMKLWLRYLIRTNSIPNIVEQHLVQEVVHGTPKKV